MKQRTPKNEGTYTKQTLNENNVKALKGMCGERGLSTNGTKAELVERLLKHVEKEKTKTSRTAKPSAETIAQPPGSSPSPAKRRRGTRGAKPKEAPLCSLCNARLTGDEAKCPGCGVTFGDEILVLFDSDWNVYREIPTSSEIIKMRKEDLLRIAQILNLEQDLDEQELREILLEVIQEMEHDRLAEETTGLSEEIISDPKKALEEINYLRDALNKHAQALALYDRMLEAVAKTNDTALLKQVLVHKGICLQGMKEFKRAVTTYDMALELDPDNIEVKALIMGARSLQKAFEDMCKEAGGECKPDPGPTVSSHPHDIKSQVDLQALEIDNSKNDRRVVDMDFKPRFESSEGTSSPVLISPTPQSPVPKPGPEPEAQARPAHNVEQDLMSEVERMSQRLERLKGLRAMVDVGDIESKGKNGSGLTLATGEPSRTPAPEQGASRPPASETKSCEPPATGPKPSMPLPTPKPSKPLATEPSKPQVIEPSEAPALVPQPMTAKRPTEPNVAEVAVETPQIPPKEAMAIKVTTGSQSLDAILGGGIPAGQTVLIRSPPLAGRDLMFHKCVASNIKSGMGAVIVTASEPIVVLRGKIGDLVRGFCDLESKGAVLWIDPRSQQMKARYPAREGPTQDQALILRALADHLASLDRAGLPAGIFISSLTPLTSYRDPKEIRSFLKDITRMVGERTRVGIFCIDSDMHDDAELRTLEEQMDAVLELKERSPGEAKGNGLLLQVKRMQGLEPTRWLPFKHDDAGFTVGQ